LAAAVVPESDLEIAVERIERIWERRTKRGGELRADFVNVRGTVDLRNLRLGATPSGLELGAEVRAVLAGQLEGSVFQIRHSVPLRLVSSFDQRLPVRITTDAGSISLQAEPRPVEIPLAIESRLGGLPLRFQTSLTLPAESLARAIHLPALVITDLRFPTRVERGRVVESKSVALEIAWSAEIPSEASAALQARGRVGWR